MVDELVGRQVGPAIRVDMSDPAAEAKGRARVHRLAAEHLAPGQVYWLVARAPLDARDETHAHMAWTTLGTTVSDDPEHWRFDAPIGCWRRGPFLTPGEPA